VRQARADPLKIAAIRLYFAREFPGWTITDRRGLGTILEIFSVEGGSTGQVFTVNVARNFLDDYKFDDLITLDQITAGLIAIMTYGWFEP